MLYLDALRSILPLYLFAANQENPLMLGEKIQWKMQPVLFLDKKYGFPRRVCRGGGAFIMPPAPIRAAAADSLTVQRSLPLYTLGAPDAKSCRRPRN